MYIEYGLHKIIVIINNYYVIIIIKYMSKVE